MIIETMTRKQNPRRKFKPQNPNQTIKNNIIKYDVIIIIHTATHTAHHCHPLHPLHPSSFTLAVILPLHFHG
jgi:hypothetical protein